METSLNATRFAGYSKGWQKDKLQHATLGGFCLLLSGLPVWLVCVVLLCLLSPYDTQTNT